MLPVEEPPTQVLENVPVGQVARAARTHPSHLLFDILIAAPASSEIKANLEVPEAPTVDVGLPLQNSIAPAIPLQTRGPSALLLLC